MIFMGQDQNLFLPTDYI